MKREYRLWSADDEARLKAAYLRGGMKEAMAEFPGKRMRGLHQKLTRMGVAGNKQMSDDEAELVRKMWGTVPLREISRALGRAESHVLNVVKFRLGLKVAVPPGWEYLSAAAARAGFDIESLKNVLRHYRVPMQGTACASGVRKSHRTIVESSEVDRAVRGWLRLETLKDAAARHGLFDGQLRRWMVDAGYQAPPPGRRWRMAPEQFDAVVDDRRTNFEPFCAAAERVGVSEPTLRKWLQEAGVQRRFPRSGLRRSVVDRVVAERRPRAA